MASGKIPTLIALPGVLVAVMIGVTVCSLWRHRRSCYPGIVMWLAAALIALPLPWETAGRRIGSLGHLTARVFGGDNTPGNLAWSCLWCNTWPQERTPSAADHDGH